jgi:hypothetical protein
MIRTSLITLALALCACGPLEVRIDETKGIPAVQGTTTVDLSTYTCGSPITAGDYTITTKVVTGGCELSFDKDVEVVKASDYTSIPELKGASNLVQRVELDVKQLAFTDATTNTPLDLSTRITSATLVVNGQVLADKAKLASLPAVVTLSGDALTAIKAKIDARQPASVRVTVDLVVPTTPAPPSKLKIDYDAQPAIIVGTGKLI